MTLFTTETRRPRKLATRFVYVGVNVNPGATLELLKRRFMRVTFPNETQFISVFMFTPAANGPPNGASAAELAVHDSTEQIYSEIEVTRQEGMDLGNFRQLNIDLAPKVSNTFLSHLSHVPSRSLQVITSCIHVICLGFMKQHSYSVSFLR